MTTTTNTTAVITGANKGLGYETARRLLSLGWTVWLGSRDERRGAEAAAGLDAQGHPGTVLPLALDVTDQASVEVAAKTIEARGGLDVLVNNAGIGGSWVTPEETTAPDFLAVYGVNVLGPVRMIHATLDLLRQSGHPRIVNVSSGMGSFAVTLDPGRLESQLTGLVYPSSKTALNMITVQYAKALTGVKVIAVDPGYTATDLNGHRGTQSVAVGAEPIVRAATIGEDGPTGSFFGQEGVLAW